MLPKNRKNAKWRKQVIDWADDHSYLNYSPVRKSIINKRVNYDLYNGKLNMHDLQLLLNPENLKGNFIPDKIQHYPILNAKLEVLVGEELARNFDYTVIVTNPLSISEIEKKKKDEILQALQETVANESQSEEQYNQKIQELSDYYTYSWKDFREVRANYLLNHYSKEQSFKSTFKAGFIDGLIVGEEIYMCDIVGGEPVLEKLNPTKVSVYRAGYSNKIEDADLIIIEDYWSPGRIIDTYHESLTQKDMRYIESLPDNQDSDAGDGYVDERDGFVRVDMIDDQFITNEGFFDPFNNSATVAEGDPYDSAGNIRVLRVFWKSYRKVKRVKSYDEVTGEETYELYEEDYPIDKTKGQEEEIFYINEAWEGVKIGKEIYVNMGPRTVQYNTLNNPSRCHFGIVGTIYNTGDSKPYSLVDKLKPFNYFYDVVHDRLNKLMAKNLGKLIKMDFAKVPHGWSVEKWLYFARVNGILAENSFNAGTEGPATGKLAASLNNASTGYVDASTGNDIQFHIQLLEYLKGEMSDVSGITKQREGQISNRETVGGVERATLQSAHITEWLFFNHEETKKRVLECFLETAKIALKGKNKKFSYILPDYSQKLVDIDGDEFAESDYGLVVDSSELTQKFKQQLDAVAQAAIQNQYSLSTIVKLYSSMSIAEKTRMLENWENRMQEQQQQTQQQAQQLQEQQLQQQAQAAQQEQEFKDKINQRDNETKILVAEINAQAELALFKAKNEEMQGEDDGIGEMSPLEREKFAESVRQFDTKMDLERDKFNFEKEKTRRDQALKLKQINKPATSATSKSSTTTKSKTSNKK